jgi:hypothetical protein
MNAPAPPSNRHYRPPNVLPHFGGLLFGETAVTRARGYSVRAAAAPIFRAEGWQSGRMRRSRKPLSVVRRIEGSNPSPSAQPSGSRRGSRFGAGARGLANRNAQSLQVRGRLRKSTDFTPHWRRVAHDGDAPRSPKRQLLHRRSVCRGLAKKPKPGDLSVLAFD